MSGQGAKRIAIIQSCYIPWRGFFDFIDRVDEFILFDDVQFAKRHWHNRNQIKTANGTLWLTIPVETKGRYLQNIDETMIAGSWADQHWASIHNAYARAGYFGTYAPRIEALYGHAAGLTRLSDVNRHFLQGLCDILGITTPLRLSSEFPVQGRKTDRLLSLCKAAGAGAYLSGPSARSYIEPEKFESAGVKLEWMGYDGYPEYPQLHGAFVPTVSVLDLIFNTGPEAFRYIRRDNNARS